MRYHLKLAALLGCAILLLGGIAQSPAHAAQQPRTVPAPFLYRPYYGSASVLARQNGLRLGSGAKKWLNPSGRRWAGARIGPHERAGRG